MSNNSPMSADNIREIRRFFRKSLNINVNYNNIFIQGLKRGIGIYTSEMPECYNQVVQRLAQNGKLGFVISDETLALGINMPFRSTCILGFKDSIDFPRLLYEQMIGRSGRRGKDTQGHIIYANVDWKNLMRGEISSIHGQEQIVPYFNVLPEINDYYSDSWKLPFEKSLVPSIAPEPAGYRLKTESHHRLRWKLRNQCKEKELEELFPVIQYMNLGNTFTPEEIIKVFGVWLHDKLPSDNLVRFIRGDTDAFTESTWSTKIGQITRLHKIDMEEFSYKEYKQVFELLVLFRDIFNVLTSDDEYNRTCKTIRKAFYELRNIIHRSNDLI
jgi:hypothetical protein